MDHLIVFGEAADIILQAFDQTIAAPDLTITRCKGLREAVDAQLSVKPGEVVLPFARRDKF